MNIKKILLLSATLILTSTAFAKDKAKTMEMSKEDRAKMAEMHSKMADCLKSDKEMSECHKEWKDSCKDMGNSCQMMMGKDKGMKHSKGKAKGMDHGTDDPSTTGEEGQKQHP